MLIHTGWGTLWGKDNARYQRGSPGLGTAAAEWLAKQDPMLVGADNSAVEVSPNPDTQLAGPAIRSSLSSTASTCSRISGSTSWPRGGRTSSR